MKMPFRQFPLGTPDLLLSRYRLLVRSAYRTNVTSGPKTTLFRSAVNGITRLGMRLSRLNTFGRSRRNESTVRATHYGLSRIMWHPSKIFSSCRYADNWTIRYRQLALTAGRQKTFSARSKAPDLGLSLAGESGIFRYRHQPLTA